MFEKKKHFLRTKRNEYILLNNLESKQAVNEIWSVYITRKYIKKGLDLISRPSFLQNYLIKIFLL